MEADPGQFTNFAKQPAQAATPAMLRQQLEQRLKSSADSSGKKKKAKQ